MLDSLKAINSIAQPFAKLDDFCHAAVVSCLPCIRCLLLSDYLLVVSLDESINRCLGN